VAHPLYFDKKLSRLVSKRKTKEFSGSADPVSRPDLAPDTAARPGGGPGAWPTSALGARTRTRTNRESCVIATN